MNGWLANFTKHLSHQRNRDWAPWLSRIKFLQRFWDIWDVQPPSCLGIRFCQKEKVRPTFKHCTPETWCTNLVGVPARCLVQYNVQLCKVQLCKVQWSRCKVMCKMHCAVQCAKCYMTVQGAMCKVLCAMQYNYSHLILYKVCLQFIVWPIHPFLYVCAWYQLRTISIYVMGQSGVDFTAWLGHWGTLMLWCTVWLVVNWYLDALCGWNTQMYPVLMHWCALWLMMNSIDDYIAICTAHTLIAWCVFCFSKHYNASVHMLLKIEWRVKKGSVNR